MADDAAGREAGAGRFRDTMAPGELRFVQDLLNTAAVTGSRASWPDLLDAPDAAAAWFRSVGITVDSPGVQDLRQLRDAICQALIARDHGVVSGAARPGEIEVPATVKLATDGTVSVAGAALSRVRSASSWPRASRVLPSAFAT